MEILDLIKSVASSLSYLIIASGFFTDYFHLSSSTARVGRIKRKRRTCLTYFTLIFTIDVVFTIFEQEVHANYMFLAITTVFIGMNMYCGNISGAIKSKVYDYVKGFSFALTILVAFQWIIAFTGSIIFILFPIEWIGNFSGFVIILSLAHLAVALFIRRFGHIVFRRDMSKKLLFIDIGAKIFFIAFFNLFFPMFFETLGMVNYSVLALALLTTAVIFAIYREYSVSLEKQIAIQASNLLTVAQWAQQTIAKYEYFLGHDDKTTNLAFYDMVRVIQSIENPILQAMLYELAYTGEKLGITIDVSVIPTDSNGRNTSGINLNNYDLYIIINEFVENAINEAKSQINKSIRVVVEHQQTLAINSFSFNIQTDISTNEGTNIVSPDFVVKKDMLVGIMERNANISISLIKTDNLIQTLKVA
ncbi:MAG: hypothetical protein FWC91_13665 [Defluviitaleaceae bacterium]|nr:hypothetical protein [Defluviitaleaceae bacterium]